MDALELLEQQLQCLATMDRLKQVLRKTSPIGMERRENSAEHSWQLILSALILRDHANEDVDLLRVVEMLAVHDIVEIEVGDTVHYFKSSQDDLKAREDLAAQKIFGALPDGQGDYYLALWREFDARQTSEAKYAVAIDRIIPFLLNSHNDGGTWKMLGITAGKIRSANQHIRDGSAGLWAWAEKVVDQSLQRGHISEC